MNKKENSGKPDVNNKMELLIREILFLRKENQLLREQIDLYNYRLEDLDNYHELLKSRNDSFIKSIPTGKSDNPKKAKVEIKLNPVHEENLNMIKDKTDSQNIEDAEFEKDFPDEGNIMFNDADNDVYKDIGDDINNISEFEFDNLKTESGNSKNDLSTVISGHSDYGKEKNNVADEKKLSLKDIEENVRMSLRKKYGKNIIRRWIIELQVFNSRPRIKTEELVSELKISIITLKRDIKFFKSKGWIEFMGHRKNGYYSITEEGKSILQKKNY